MKVLSQIIVISLVLSGISLRAQMKKEITEADKSGLEGIIIEKYYINDGSDALDTTGGALPNGAVTYRIYVDMKPEYKLQAVYGVPNHDLYIKTSTRFFNNTKWGDISGDKIDDKKIGNSTAAFDSWITIGAATDEHNGVLKTEDTDGSIIKCVSLAKADGMIATKIKPITFFGFDLGFFNNPTAASSFTGNNGSWAVFGNMKGATNENKVLIAQLTTDGTLSFQLNLQMGTPTGGILNYVAKNPQENEIQNSSLVH